MSEGLKFVAVWAGIGVLGVVVWALAIYGAIELLVN